MKDKIEDKTKGGRVEKVKKKKKNEGKRREGKEGGGFLTSGSQPRTPGILRRAKTWRGVGVGVGLGFMINCEGQGKMGKWENGNLGR